MKFVLVLGDALTLILNLMPLRLENYGILRPLALDLKSLANLYKIWVQTYIEILNVIILNVPLFRAYT